VFYAGVRKSAGILSDVPKTFSPTADFLGALIFELVGHLRVRSLSSFALLPQLGMVVPDAINGIGERNFCGIAPFVFCRAHFAKRRSRQ
jgi:hypothetical protein